MYQYEATPPQEGSHHLTISIYIHLPKKSLIISPFKFASIGPGNKESHHKPPHAESHHITIPSHHPQELSLTISPFSFESISPSEH